MKIVEFIDCFSFNPMGGAGRYLWETAKRLANSHDVTIICQRRNDDIPLDGSVNSVRFLTYDSPPGPVDRYRAAQHSIPRLYQQSQLAGPADVYNFQHPLAYSILHKFSEVNRSNRCFYTFYSSWPEEHISRNKEKINGFFANLKFHIAVRLRQFHEDKALTSFREFIVLSNFSKNQILSKVGSANRIFHVIPGGADIELFHPSNNRDNYRQSLNLGTDEIVLLTVRRLDPRMGVWNLVRAFDRLHGDYPNLRLLIGGTGPERDRIADYIDAQSLGEKIRFLGYVADDDLPRLYNAADLFVLPTIEMEGFGLVTVESLACGTPVVGTPVGATPEILSPLDPDLLFASASVDDLVSGLRNILDNRPDILQERDRFRHYIEAEYYWAKTAASHERVFREKPSCIS